MSGGQQNIGIFEPTDFNNETLTKIVPLRNKGIMLFYSVCGTNQGVRHYNMEDTQPPKVRKSRRCLVEVDSRKCPDPF